MTDMQANKLVLLLQYNFAGFMPPDIQGAALKKGMWMAELVKHDYKPAEEAVLKMINTLHYPPQLADLRETLVPAIQRREQAALPGPTFGTQEGYDAMYTADMDRVNALMAKLMEEL